MQIKWVSVQEALPDEDKKILISGENFATQAFYHAGMYWQDANIPQRYPLASVTKWADMTQAQDVGAHGSDKSMEPQGQRPMQTLMESLEQMAEEYAKGHWIEEEERHAAYRGYVTGYCKAIEAMKTEARKDHE